jgi:flagellar biosynthesis chaperone FliJ
MTHDRRGFQYALDPVRSLTGWKVDELTLELAQRQAAVDAQQRRVDALAADFKAARMRLMAQRQAQAVLDVGAERGAHAYLVRVQTMLAAESAALGSLQARRDETRTALLEARRRADSLERDRDAALAEHDLATARRTFVDADDNWMQRQHWRKST